MNLDGTKAVAILGDTNSGKTNLAFHLLRSYKGNKKIYLLGYPKQIDNFTILSNFHDIFTLTDSIIFIDEIQRYIRIYEKRTNQELLELISLFSHNNNTLIFTTQLSQFITKAVESFIEGWCITRVKNTSTLKNGSKPKMIVKETAHPQCTKRSLALKDGQYLEYSDNNLIIENGIKEFPFQGIGKDWRINKNSEKVTTKVATEDAKKNKKADEIELFKQKCRNWVTEQIKKGNYKLEKCEICGYIKSNHPSGKYIGKGILMAHHKQYTYPFTLEDLQTVCQSCHTKLHNKLKIEGIDITVQEVNDLKKSKVELKNGSP